MKGVVNVTIITVALYLLMLLLFQAVLAIQHSVAYGYIQSNCDLISDSRGNNKHYECNQ